MRLSACARALRQACLFLRWEVVRDTVPEANIWPPALSVPSFKSVDEAEVAPGLSSFLAIDL
jgi:hypothetical protein